MGPMPSAPPSPPLGGSAPRPTPGNPDRSASAAPAGPLRRHISRRSLCPLVIVSSGPTNPAHWGGSPSTPN
eukprot:7602380-Alexandrium_andersonii.AAC.1